jgi:ribonuclease G
LPKFSEDIKFIGKYVIVAPNTTEHVFSKQLTAEPYDISDKYLDTGLIFRSSVEDVTNDKLIENEIDFLIKQAEIIKAWQQLPLGLLNQPTYKFMQLLREAKLSPKTHVYTNSQLLFDRIVPYTNLWQFAGVDLDKSLAIPSDEISIKIYAEFGLELHKLSGINLIDINSKNAPLSFFSVNYLAIDEIVRQILLQDLTGIILLDFIKNMSMFDQQKILAKLTKCMSNDWRRNQILGFTKAGICEIIRNK